MKSEELITMNGKTPRHPMKTLRSRPATLGRHHLLPQQYPTFLPGLSHRRSQRNAVDYILHHRYLLHLLLSPPLPRLSPFPARHPSSAKQTSWTAVDARHTSRPFASRQRRRKTGLDGPFRLLHTLRSSPSLMEPPTMSSFPASPRLLSTFLLRPLSKRKSARSISSSSKPCYCGSTPNTSGVTAIHGWLPKPRRAVELGSCDECCRRQRSRRRRARVRRVRARRRIVWRARMS